MKHLLTIILTLFYSYCFSQVDNYKFPKITLTGQNKNDFIPSGWTIRDTVVCDFNKDSLIDVAIVIETKQPLIFEDTTCFSTQPFFPKMLIVLLRQPDKTLQLKTTAKKLFGNCNWGVQGLDPFEKLDWNRNTLGITFLTGGTLRNWLTYYFRLQDNDWFLIGAESFQYSSGHTDGKDAFYTEKLNFLTGTKESYNEDQNKKQNSYKKTTFEMKPLIKLTDFNENTSLPFDDN